MRSVKYRIHLPENFLKKEVNEESVRIILTRALGASYAKHGDPKKREPDLLIDGRGEEVTFAADGKYLRPFIGQYCDGTYQPSEAINSATMPILSALERKSRKKYSDRPVAVAVFCMLELFDWSENLFDNELMGLPKKERDAFFSLVRSLYIESGIFSEVHLITPTLTRGWVVFCISSGEGRLVQVRGADETFLPWFERAHYIEP